MIIAARHCRPAWIEKYKTLAGDAIVAIGGGSLIDEAKQVALATNRKLIVVPTGLTTDSMFTSTSAYRPKPGVVKYKSTRKPDLVVYDPDILKEAPRRFMLVGWAEVFSIITACERWKKMDSYNSELAVRAKALVDDAKGDSFKCLFESLKEEVRLCELAGTDDLEEGIEHFVAYKLEKFAPNRLHSELLFITIPIVAGRYSLREKDISNRLNYIGGFKEVSTSFERLRNKTKQILDEEFTHEFE